MTTFLLFFACAWLVVGHAAASSGREGPEALQVPWLVGVVWPVMPLFHMFGPAGSVREDALQIVVRLTSVAALGTCFWGLWVLSGTITETFPIRLLIYVVGAAIGMFVAPLLVTVVTMLVFMLLAPLFAFLPSRDRD